MIIEAQRDRTIFNSKFLTRISLKTKYDKTYRGDSSGDFCKIDEIYEITAIIQGSDCEYILARYESEEEANAVYDIFVSALIKNEPYYKMQDYYITEE